MEMKTKVAYVACCVLSLCVTLMTPVVGKEITRNTSEEGEEEALQGSSGKDLQPTTVEEIGITDPEPSLKDLGTERNRRSTNVRKRAIERQLKELKKLKCKPHRQKVYVRHYLDETSPYLDMQIYPEVLSIKKCEPKCSACADSRGKETKTCLPKVGKQKTRNYTAYTYGSNGNREYFKVPIKVDTKCECR